MARTRLLCSFVPEAPGLRDVGFGGLGVLFGLRCADACEPRSDFRESEVYGHYVRSRVSASGILGFMSGVLTMAHVGGVACATLTPLLLLPAS